MKKILFLLFSLATTIGVSAQVTLPEIIGSGMILQQNAMVSLWGWADPHTSVTVTPSWGGVYTARSDASGRWITRIETPSGGYEPRQIVLAGKGKDDKVVLDNVLIGEVWFAGGQSNMEMTLGGFWHCPVPDANDIVAQAASKRNKLRYVRVSKAQHFEPQERVGGKWNECTPTTAAGFTAVGYFFSEMLNNVLDVPVGIIDCTWGGSRVESWLNREILSTYPDVDITPEGYAAWTHEWTRPLGMYNGMLNALTDYTIKGFIWYQGESNVDRYADYAQRLSEMVAFWRSRWGQGDIPFYYVEIAPYRDYTDENGALLREAQYKAQQLIPNSCMVSTNDLVESYEAANIHPKEKRTIGRRLAYCALNRNYGMPEVACEGPQFEKVEFRDGKATVSFTHAELGFNRMAQIEGFEICGADKVFYPASATIGAPGSIAIVSSPQVAEPVAVRYGFRNFLPGNLGNTRGLPVVPFRTDNF